MDALKKGRPIDAYVEGLNHKQFSELSGVPLPVVEKLLVQITREQVPEIYKYVRKDALIVIDELQNFWPSGRQQQPPEITKFVTEHGHEGQDIIGMGQVLTDCHNLFKNRCQRKFVFRKQDQVGRETHYNWIAYNGKINDQGRVVFTKANSGTRQYDETYFGLYKSHTDGTSNFETFEDARTNIFNNKTFRLGLPAAVAIAFGAIYYLASFVFSGSGLVSAEQLDAVNAPKPQQQNATFQTLQHQFDTQTVTTPPSTISQPPDEDQIKYAPPEDYVDSIAQQYKLRLAGVVHNPKTNTTVAVIQAFDNTLHLKERFTTIELAALGWEVEITPYGARLHREERQYVVRPWPIDPFGRVNKSTVNQL